MLVFRNNGLPFEAIGASKAIEHTADDGMTLAEFEQASGEVERDCQEGISPEEATIAHHLGDRIVLMDESSTIFRQAS